MSKPISAQSPDQTNKSVQQNDPQLETFREIRKLMPNPVEIPLIDGKEDKRIFVEFSPSKNNGLAAAFQPNENSGVSTRPSLAAANENNAPVNLAHALAAPQTTENDREFYELGLKVKKGDMEDLIGAWRQTTEGNCVTVGIAKAACDAYGKNVFKKIKSDDDGIQVKLHNNKEIKLSWSELSTARDYSDFRGSNEAALAFGTLIYAVAAKSALNAKHEGSTTYKRALVSLNNGEYVNRVVGFLGLEDKLVKVNSADLEEHDAIIAASKVHVVYINLGEDGKHYTDSYGKPKVYNRTDTNGGYYHYYGLFGRKSSRSSNAIYSAYTLKPLDATGA
jgi:hypothetical protein